MIVLLALEVRLEGVIVGRGSVLSMGVYLGLQLKLLIAKLEKFITEKFRLTQLWFLALLQAKMALRFTQQLL